MNLEKTYYDMDEKPCNILELVKKEPEWAANRIQEGEVAIDILQTIVKSGIVGANYDNWLGRLLKSYLDNHKISAS